MNYISLNIKSILKTIPSNAFLLFLTGFFLAQFMLINILYTKHPLGGWVTSLGTFNTSIILLVFLTALSLCLVALWRSVNVNKNSKLSRVKEVSKINKALIVKTRNCYSPIDYPIGSTQPVVSGYTLG